MCDIFSTMLIIGTLSSASGGINSRSPLEFDTNSIEAKTTMLDCQDLKLDLTVGHYESSGSRNYQANGAELRLQYKLW